MQENQTHVLLWSQSQSAFHIEPIGDMLNENAHAFFDDRRMDYVPMLFGTPDQCHGIADQLRGTLHARQLAKVA